MIVLLYNGLKRLFFGSTSIFSVRSGSVPIAGASFVAIHTERTKMPTKIVGVQFAVDLSMQGEWRICVNGEKCFPFSEVNSLDSNYHNLMAIDVAAGELMTVEVRSRNKDYRGIAILEELNVIEIR